jgi:nucleoside-diphosphate-sugar epimerase
VRQPVITRARAILGWEPTIGLADGLEMTLRSTGAPSAATRS